MRKFLSLVFVVALLVISVEIPADAAKYKYIYKNGKKYKVKIKPKSKKRAKYKYIYKNGKKYKVRIKPKRSSKKSRLTKKRPLTTTQTTNKFAQNDSMNSSDVREFFGFKGRLYGGADLVMRSVSNDYSVKTKQMTNDNNETFKLKFGETGTIMYTDGKTYNFSKSLSTIGLNFKGGFEMLNKDKVELSFYYDSEEIDIGLGYKYVMPSFSIWGIDPYVNAKLLLAYKELSDIFGIVPNSFAFAYGFGGEKKFSNKIFMNFGIEMSSKTWAEETTTYTNEEKTTKDTNIFFGANYRL